MRAEDIVGLSPEQIRDKFALPDFPQFICDVVIPAGTHLRVGIANDVSGWGDGGGKQ